MRWCVVFAVAIAGCGRLGFEARDARPTGDGALGDGVPGDSATEDSGGAPDALPAACAEAFPITTGVTPFDTCTGDTDRIDGCGPANTREIVLRFRPAVTAGFTYAAYDAGTSNISTSTARLMDDCATLTNCSGITSTTLTGGVDHYFVIESSSGGCASIDFSIQ